MRDAARLLVVLVCTAAAWADEPPAADAAGRGEAVGPWSAIEPIQDDLIAGTVLGGDGQSAAPREDRAVRRSNSGARSTGAAAGEDGGGWLRSIGSLGAVVAVILFLAWGYRATTSGAAIRLRARRPGLIQIVSRTSLSNRQSLCLVRVGPRMVLVGMSGDGLRTLDVIDDADLVSRLAGEAESVKTDPRFKAALERDLSRYEPETAPAATPATGTRARIAQVLETLARAKR